MTAFLELWAPPDQAHRENRLTVLPCERWGSAAGVQLSLGSPDLTEDLAQV